MIDWWGLFHNSLWVVGLAVGLAALSMASYEARVEEVRLRQKLNGPGFQLPLAVGMVLVCLGLLFSSGSWWEKVIWGTIAALFAGQAVRLWRRVRADRVTPVEPGAPLNRDDAGESHRTQ
jgi:hypothetical protein